MTHMINNFRTVCPPLSAPCNRVVTRDAIPQRGVADLRPGHGSKQCPQASPGTGLWVPDPPMVALSLLGYLRENICIMGKSQHHNGKLLKEKMHKFCGLVVIHEGFHHKIVARDKFLSVPVHR